MPVEIKKTSYMYGYAALIVVVSALLVWQKAFTVKEAGLFATGALAFPGMVGISKKKDDDDNHDGGVTVVAEEPKLPTLITPIMVLAFIGATTVESALLTACFSPSQKAAAADATYQGDMLKCVDDAKTIEESKACRAKVREQWHVDAGGDAR